jgi:hypothetical protein
MSPLRHHNLSGEGATLAAPVAPPKAGSFSLGHGPGLVRLLGVLVLWVGLGLLLAAWLAQR